MRTAFTTDVSHTQIAVFWADPNHAFNEWTREQFAQGFSWRPGSVSFGTLGDGTTIVSMMTAEVHEVRPDAIRAIAVPFEVVVGGRVQIAPLWDEHGIINLPPGHYRLIFEHGLMEDGDMWCDFTFIPVPAPIPAEILRADPELSPPAELVMTAEPVCEPDRSDLN